MTTTNIKHLDIAISSSTNREHLGKLVCGIIKQILFHRNQMPMPYDILEHRIKTGRSTGFNEKLPLLHAQLRGLFQSIAEMFGNRNLYLDQVALLLGSNRFTGKELHVINLPVLASRTALADLRLDDLNSILRFVVEEDPFSRFSAGMPTCLHVFVRACPLDLEDPFLDVFEPMLRYSPEVSSNCPQSVFNLRFHTKPPEMATVRRSGSHWSLCPSQRKKRELEPLPGVRRRLFDDSQLEDSVCFPETPEKSPSGEIKSKFNDVLSEDLENDSEDETGDCENVFAPSANPASFIWYRSKSAITGWAPCANV